MLQITKAQLVLHKPQNLKELYTLVLKKPLPSLAERGALFEEYGIGPKEEYLGTAGQNMALLEMFYLLAEQREIS